MYAIAQPCPQDQFSTVLVANWSARLSMVVIIGELSQCVLWVRMLECEWRRGERLDGVFRSLRTPLSACRRYASRPSRLQIWLFERPGAEQEVAASIFCAQADDDAVLFREQRR